MYRKQKYPSPPVAPKGAEPVPQPYNAADRAERRDARRRRLSLSILIASTQDPEVVLAAGVYREQLLLERPVTLVAAGGPGSVRIVTEHGPALIVRAGAVLRGIIVESADSDRPAVVVESGSPVFEQCEFRGARVETADGSTPIFRRCAFVRTALAGLYARGRSVVRIEQSVFSGIRGHGIVGVESSMLEVHESRVENAEGAGLRLLDEARADVRGGTISDSRDPGAVVADTAALRMVGCRISGGAAEGIRVDGSSPLRPPGQRRAPAPQPAADPESPTPTQILRTLSSGPLSELRGVHLEDCDIADAALEGVLVGGGEVRLDRTRLTGARRAGLLAGGSARVELRGCAVAGAADAGLLARGTASVRAADLDVVGCGGYGVGVAEHAEVELTDSRLTDTAQTSVYLIGNAVVRAVRTTLRESGDHGVHVRGHAIAEFNACRVESCAHDGMRVEGTADTVLRDTEFLSCRIGIVLATRHHPVLRDCRVRDVQRMGIVVGPGGMPTLSGCSIVGAGAGGIFLDDNSAPRIEDCRVERTGGGGITVGAGAAPTVRGTTVTGTAESALYFHDGASGVFEGCRVTRRADGPAAVHLGRNATPELRGLVEEIEEPAGDAAALSASAAAPDTAEIA